MSGYIAAKILMQHFKQGQELALFLNNQKQSPAEIQMQRRLEGFMQYLTENHVGLTVHDVLLENGAYPSTLGYLGFEKSCCTSLNEVICHGIPDSTVIQDGDIVNIDVTVIKDGWHGDTSRMYFVGTPSVMARRLVDVTREAMFRGIRAVKPGATLVEGTLDVGVTGRDLLRDSGAKAEEVLELGFGRSRFRFAGPIGRFSDVADLAGCRIATATATSASTASSSNCPRRRRWAARSASIWWSIRATSGRRERRRSPPPATRRPRRPRRGGEGAPPSRPPGPSCRRRGRCAG